MARLYSDWPCLMKIKVLLPPLESPRSGLERQPPILRLVAVTSELAAAGD